MIAADFGDIRFQLRAGAAVVRGTQVLLHRADGDVFWSLPGGRVEPDEAGADTVVRELHEETGAVIVVDRFVATVETFFRNRGRRWHEIGLYYACRLADPAQLPPDSFVAHDGPVRLTFTWFELAALPGADLRPVGLSDVLLQPPGPPRHWVQRDPEPAAP